MIRLDPSLTLMVAAGPVGVGFIGTGMISNTYLENLTRFPDISAIAKRPGAPAHPRCQPSRERNEPASSARERKPRFR